jgi:hypothetical protein
VRRRLTRVEAMASLEAQLADADALKLDQRPLTYFKTASLETHRDFISRRLASTLEAILRRNL